MEFMVKAILKRAGKTVGIEAINLSTGKAVRLSTKSLRNNRKLLNLVNATILTSGFVRGHAMVSSPF